MASQISVFDPNFDIQLSRSVPLRQTVDDVPEPVVVNWGALRLFVTALNFFNRYVSLEHKSICVYAGAAPGVSIDMLASLYPSVEYHLYDPNGDSDRDPLAFDMNLRNRPNVSLYPMEFTMETAVYWKEYIASHPNERVYFISDIRSSDYPEKPSKEPGETSEIFRERYLKEMRKREAIVVDELRIQEEWTKTIVPAASLLKFRLPKFSIVDDKTFMYLDGYVYRSAFADATSTECFLVPSDSVTTREWNTEEYEKAMNYHNYDFRTLRFRNPLTGGTREISRALGLTADYDSCLFVITVQNYLTRYSVDGGVASKHHLDILRREGITSSTDKEIKEGDPLTIREYVLMLSAKILNGLGRIYNSSQRGMKAANLVVRRARLSKSKVAR
jgi:hypothetical protein